MSTDSEPSVSFGEVDDRRDRMHSAIDDWLAELTELVAEARASEAFQEWLDAQSRFPDYSAQNTLLINHQCPEATKVAGYQTWQEAFDRHVKEGEQAIWIWAPIIAKRCPECENSKSYHDDSDCEYDETPAEGWSKGLVGFKPAPVFDVSQTEGEPLPELVTDATGEAGELVGALLEAADDLGIEARIVDEDDWSHGDATGVCRHRAAEDRRPLVAAKARPNDAALAATLIHEYAHAQLHFDVDEPSERAKREVEAEAVAYVVGRYFGLDTSNSAFYLAAWEVDETDAIRDRLQRISGTSAELIGTIDGSMNAVTT